MSEKVHETLASGLYGLFAGALSLFYGAVIDPKVRDAAFQITVTLITLVLGAIAGHYVRKMLKAIDSMMEGSMEIPVWAKGLAAAFIGGAANVLTGMITDPASFQVANAKKIGISALVGGVMAVALYLKASPLPSQAKS